MAMITGFLIAYALFTAPFIAMGVWRAYKGKPKADDAIEATYTNRVLFNVIDQMGKSAEAWFIALRDGQSHLKRDNQAMLQATKVIAQSMIEIKGLAQDFTKAPTREKRVEDFVHSLELVRDRYTKTASQKKVVESIISNIKTSHGPKAK